MDRRNFIKSMLAATVIASISFEVKAGQVLSDKDWQSRHKPKVTPMPLWLRRNDESVTVDCATDEGYRSACYMLRDTRANKVGMASQNLLAHLSWMQLYLASYDRHAPFDINSGLRVDATNRHTEGASHGSLHKLDNKGLFHAADIHMEGIPATYLGKLAATIKTGGIGIYAKRGFIHADDGPERYWYQS